jgi:6-phospho 3-hexuloisomerase
MKNSDTFSDSLEYIQRKIKSILLTVPKEDIEKINKSFFTAKRIFVYVAGRSGLVSKAFAIRLVHLGFQTFVIGETIGAPVKKGDLVCIISGSGETIPAVMTAEIAKNIGAHVLVITADKNSKITRFSDESVILSAECHEQEKKLLAPLGTLFEASTWIFLDGIIALLMQRKGETEQTMRSRHATLE